MGLEVKRLGVVGKQTKVGEATWLSKMVELTSCRRVWFDGCSGRNKGCCKDTGAARVWLWIRSWSMMLGFCANDDDRLNAIFASTLRQQ